MNDTEIVTEPTTTQVVKRQRTKVAPKAQRQKVVSSEFSGFRIKFVNDPIGKKKLSNELSITVPDSRTESTIRLTLREATALKNFLNKNLE